MRRALVTGGASGLGRAMVAELAARGYSVASVDLTADEPDLAEQRFVCDLADRDAIDRMLPAIVAAGPYEIVMLNAGISATGRYEDIPVEAYLRLLTVNTETPLLLSAALMRAGAVKRAICFVSSLSHYTGYPGASVYAASKDAVAVYAKSVRKPFARRGVTVTLACPGPLRTAHAERHAPEGADPALRMDPAEAAREILAATMAGRARIVPGRKARALAALSQLAPSLVMREMRRRVYERLKGPVW